jgi:ABC-2 type transport system ATP-binding protein
MTTFAAMANAIEAEGLTKKWGDFTAVDSLQLSVAEGECYAFLGRNGAGKSTTARMLLDFLRPTSGSVKVLGGAGRDPAVRARIGYLPGDLNLPGHMTGIEAVEYFGSVGNKPDRVEVGELSERLGLNPERPFHELSTGSRRKVGLVLAFMNDPDLLILDEPTSGLDPAGQLEMRHLIPRLAGEGRTIFISSHLMHEIQQICDRVIILKQGVKLAEGPVETLLHENAGSGSIEVRVPDDDRRQAIDLLTALDWVTAVDSSARTLVVSAPAERSADINATLARAGVYAAELRPREVSLEEFFLEVTGDGGHS